ncbi:hypothetical protein [Janibacter anophelis]|uniref:hypothetical protein n=1 Tax=Janibacter anophelis TaxID=319054 RepID=UPI00157B2229|nr:hypothetical protein [Janibacter anophelis]
MATAEVPVRVLFGSPGVPGCRTGASGEVAEGRLGSPPLGYFERGPLPEDEGIGGTWSTYYYNGHLYSSDIARGFDVLKFMDPATKRADSIVMDEFNAQSQPRYSVR